MARLRASQTQDLRRSRRNASSVYLNLATFLYECTIDYSLHLIVSIGPIEVVFKHCGALKFAGETPGLCCLNNKVKLPLLTPPPYIASWRNTRITKLEEAAL
ncbi:unnamed protein product [Euphydryas editha]|uniref:Uncharacterized protein n=1 Tax=Euphydryas editha TaxID=104508 RepID=A0AAU9TGY2_EUPED|nr:unnamed protein product [Euphydryas editha]